jgi:hypothetical protein
VYGLCVARDSTSEGDRESGSPFGIDCFSSDFRGEWSIGSLSCCACPDIATNQTERRQWLRIYISERIEGATFCERMIGRRKCGTVEFEIGFSSELSVILFCDPYFMCTNPLWLVASSTPALAYFPCLASARGSCSVARNFSWLVRRYSP